MLSLIKAELYKLKHLKIFYLGIVLNLFIVISMLLGRKTLGSINNVSYFVNIMYRNYSFALPILCFSTTFASQEFSQKTIYPVIAKGVSFSKVFISKAIVSCMGTMLYFIIGSAVGIGLSFYVFPDNYAPDLLSSIVKIFLLETLIHIAYTVFVLAITYVIRSSKMSILTNFTIMIFLPALLHGIMKTFNPIINLRSLWIVNVVNLLEIGRNIEWFYYAFIISIFYIVVCTLISVLVGNKRDIS